MARTITLSDLVDALEAEVARRDISYNQAARELGVSPQRLSQWRRGARVEWTAQLQHDVAAFLGLSPIEVLALSGLDVSDRPAASANLPLAASTVPGYRSRRPCGRMAQFFRRWRRRPDDADLALAA